MSFNIWFVHIALLLLWVSLYVFLGAINKHKGTILANVFQNNDDLDSTLGILLKGGIVFAVLSIVIVYFMMFHDDLSEENVGMLGMHVISMGSMTIKDALNVNNGKGNDKV